jgi:hypothetical protein
MGLMQWPYAPDVPFERPTDDADGNTTWASLGTVKTAVNLTGPALQSSSGTSVAQAGTVGVPRGSNLKVGDRFTWGADKYTLTSGPNGDMVHPATGDDLGWVTHTFMGKAARWGRG